MLDLSICIVNWNTENVLKECLRSIYQQTKGIDYEVIVVDNASKDGSIKMIKEYFPQVRIILNNENKGFATANNQATRLAIGKYIIFLNPDTIISNNPFLKMIQFMEINPNIGALGCKLINEDGSIQNSIRNFPSFSSVLIGTTILSKFPFIKRLFINFKLENFSFNETKEVDVVSGAALLIRKSVLEDVKLWDEGYFMFMEDLDLCRRIKLRGYKIYFLHDAQIIHIGGESRNKNPELIIKGVSSIFRYFNKFEGKRKTLLFKILYKPSFILGLIFDLILDILKMFKYEVIKRNQLKFDKTRIKIHRNLLFFKKDILYFIFKL